MKTQNFIISMFDVLLQVPEDFLVPSSKAFLESFKLLEKNELRITLDGHRPGQFNLVHKRRMRKAYLLKFESGFPSRGIYSGK